MSKKLMIGLTIIVVLFSTALGIGVYSFDNTSTTKTVKAEIATIKTIDAKQIQKSENIITKLGTSPVDKAIAKTYEIKKVKEAQKAAKKAEKIAKAKRAKAKKAKKMAGFKKLGTFNASAYCGCASCCGSAGGHTASGTTPRAGRTIATDPSVIPLGSKVMINGHVYTAEDTGGAIGGKRIDIFFSSHGAALQFGRRSVEVYVKK